MFDDVQIVTGPASDSVPESLSVLKAALRIEHTADDTYLTELMRAAADQITTRTGRQVLTCTRRLALCEFWSGSIEIPYPRLQSINSIEYIDEDGDTQTLSSSLYSVYTSGVYGRVIMRGTTPAVDPDHDKPVAIYYDCGYGTDQNDVPSGLRVAVRELVRFWYEEPDANRFTAQRAFPQHVDALLDPWKLRKFWK